MFHVKHFNMKGEIIMIKTVKVNDLVRYARNCADFAKTDRLSNKVKKEYRLRADTIRAFLASEDANRKYKPGTGKDKQWSEYFNKVWNEYDEMIFR